MRLPVVAGSFYDAEADGLKAQLEASFLSGLGPGTLPGQRKIKDNGLRGVIVPHAGYYFSGACAAHAYSLISETAISRFVLLGVNHYGHETALSSQDWKTPLGEALADKELIKKLKGIGIKDSESPHIREHSIEVQLPFLQYVKKGFKFVAVGLSHDAPIDKIASCLAEMKDIIIIASSDFTHYGFNYGYMPFTSRVKENLEKLDREAIGFILNNDPSGFERYISRTGITICGYLPILAVLRSVNIKGRLLKYYTSGDVLGDFRNSVSYASIAFE